MTGGSEGSVAAPGIVRCDVHSDRLLTVVIVTYCSAEDIGGCLASLPAALRGCEPWRVVVVDNASTDATVAVARDAFPDARVIERAGNDGFAAGVNAGLREAGQGDVLVLNADVRLAPDSVRRLRYALAWPRCGIAVPRITDDAGNLCFSLRRRPSVLRSFGEAVIGGGRAGRLAALGEMVVNPGDYAHSRQVDWATGAVWLVSEESIAALGPLDERYRLYSEETEYMLRANERGIGVIFEPAAAAVHRGGDQGRSAELWALSVTNRVRLHRERRGIVAAHTMRAILFCSEAIRALMRQGSYRNRHRAALRALIRFERWPGPLWKE
jgi:GT2 family glycosyltransferase